MIKPKGSISPKVDKNEPVNIPEIPAGFEVGEVRTLKAVRDSDMGVFLDAGTGNTSEDILLHKQQQITPVQVGDTVAVYLYLDPKKRLAASMRLPRLKVGEVGPGKLMGVTKAGGFVDIGAERGIFLPYREMRGKPKIGSTIWIKPYKDKSGRLAVTMNVDEDMVKNSLPAEVQPGQEVTVLIWRDGDLGYSALTPEGALAFIHHDETPQPLTVGDEITARVAYIREDGRINLSLRPVKEKAMDLDAEKIVEFLKNRTNFAMPYSDETSPEIIREKFNLSKSAFKRALGRLMKETKVYQEEGWTILAEDQR